MQKVSMELFRVHKYFKVKFCIFVNDDTTGNDFNQSVRKFNYGGNDYLTITPFPFITIDITTKDDKKEEWNSNRTFNMNRRDLFNMCCKLRSMLQTMTTVKELFAYDYNGNLYVNENLAMKYKEVFVSSNKTILMQHCVVNETEQEHENFYEGMFLSINSMDYFSFLTFEEMRFLLHELERIDMSSLSMQLINTYYLMKEMESKQIEKKLPVAEKEEEEIIDKKSRIEIEEPHTIPDI